MRGDTATSRRRETLQDKESQGTDRRSGAAKPKHANRQAVDAGAQGNGQPPQELAAVVNELRNQREVLNSSVSAVTAATEALDAQQRMQGLLADAHECVRKLSEQFHEREVLDPLFRGLILVADRCRIACRRTASGLRTTGRKKPALTQKALSYLIQARKADCVEIENLLALHGVEMYHHSGPRFDPTSQHRVHHVSITNSARHGLIARRVLPGYRRAGRIIRPELVDVYIFESSATTQGDPA